MSWKLGERRQKFQHWQNIVMENQDTIDSTVEEAEASGAGTGLCTSESDYDECKSACSNLVDSKLNLL